MLINMNTPMNIQDAEKVLLEIKELMDELNVTFFLRHGTCLGAIRDNEIIKWDDDLDIGSIIGMNGLTKKTIYKAINKFKLAGFEVEAGESPGHIGVTLRKFGIVTDWSCYRIIDGSIYQYPAVKIPAELHDDLKPISFLGTTFLVPNPPEEYFLLKYGPEWHIPKEKDYEGDIINSIPESVILQQPSIFTRINKLLFPNKYITKIRILTHDNKPVELAKVTLVGIGRCTTDHEGYAKFNLLTKSLHFEDLYSVIIEKDKDKEILYLEILKPGINYYYLPSKDKSHGRSNVLKELR